MEDELPKTGSHKMTSHSYFNAVYDLVRLIPFGRVSTYGAIANALGLGSARMVGWALNHAGSADGDVPAHRVVNRKGELSGQLHFSPQYSMAQRLMEEDIPVQDDVVQNFEKYFWDPAQIGH